MPQPTFTGLLPSRTSLARACACVIAALSAAACGSRESVPRTGFIPLSVPLAHSASDPTTSVWHDSAALDSPNRKIAVTQVEVGSLAEDRMTDDQEAEVKLRFRRALEAAFGDRLASAGGPDVIEVRACITDFKPNKPLRNIAPQTQVLRRGYGYAACEIEATLGGRPVAAMASTVDTQRFGTEKLSDMGTADAACATWAQKFAALVGAD
jgi:hypothetical protein